MARKVEISQRTIFFVFLLIGSLWFFYFIRDVIMQVFVSLLIMTILNPTVTKLQREYKIPRAVSVGIVYVALIATISFVVGILVSPLLTQTTNFANNLPKYLNDLNVPIFITDGLTRELTDQVGRLPTQVIKIGVSVFSNVFSVFTVFVFALYFLLAREKLNQQISILFKNSEVERRVERVINKLEYRLGGWARGEIVLMFLVGFASYIGLTIVGVPYALPLGIIAGLLEIIPNVGPIISSVPAILVGFSISPLTGLAVAMLYVLIQQIENYVFVPKVMEKSAGVSAIVTLLSLVIGFRIAGVLGALLSVPVVITSRIIMEEFVFNQKAQETPP